MFTVKLIRYISEDAIQFGGRLESVIECPHYTVYERRLVNEDGQPKTYSITTFPSPLAENGVECHVGPRPQDFEHCYIENASGKTIAHYSWRGVVEACIAEQEEK